MKHENPKHRQGDGAGFGRLRAEQAKRAAFHHLIRKSHPIAEIYIDQIREYAGVQVAFFRTTLPGPSRLEQTARIAVFENRDGMWVKTNDIIAAVE